MPRHLRHAPKRRPDISDPTSDHEALDETTMPFPPPIGIGFLTILLGLAAWFDTRQSRIPNSIVALVLLLGFALHTADGGLSGAGVALYGLVVGLVLTLPFYVVNALGAGDVKLIAAVGAFVGAQAVIGTILAILLCGGVFALWAIASQRFKASTNVGQVDISPEDIRKTKFPFAASIACGTLAYLAIAEYVL